MSRDWVLTSSSCWKHYTDAALLLSVGDPTADTNTPREVIVDRVVHYPGSLDVAMVKIFAAPEAVTERNFPCVLSEKGTQQALRKRTHGILQTLRINPRRRERISLRSYPFQVVDSPTRGARNVRVRGTHGRMPRDPVGMRDAPFFVKVGISRWAFVGFNERSPPSGTDTLVGTSYPAIRWIDRLLY